MYLLQNFKLEFLADNTGKSVTKKSLHAKNAEVTAQNARICIHIQWRVSIVTRFNAVPWCDKAQSRNHQLLKYCLRRLSRALDHPPHLLHPYRHLIIPFPYLTWNFFTTIRCMVFPISLILRVAKNYFELLSWNTLSSFPFSCTRYSLLPPCNCHMLGLSKPLTITKHPLPTWRALFSYSSPQSPTSQRRIVKHASHLPP